MTDTSITAAVVKHIASLANIPVTPDEEQSLATGFNTVLKVVETLNTLDTKGVEPTHQVTGLANVYREDKVDTGRMLTQEEALANAPRCHNGYFMVSQVREEK